MRNNLGAESHQMITLSRPARVLVSIAVVSLVAMVLVYAFPPSDRRAVVHIGNTTATFESHDHRIITARFSSAA